MRQKEGKSIGRPHRLHLVGITRSSNNCSIYTFQIFFIRICKEVRIVRIEIEEAWDSIIFAQVIRGS